uniref:INO80 complex subunit E N-terminal domain-containing protein n=1 Tax=Anopheles braziliensis TaxID=58242 RepID=A0A2M3ZC04_9DIPT
MLEGWYCRSMHEQARQQSEMDSFNTEPDLENDSTEDESDDEGSGKREVDYKSLYNDLKKKLKILLYENVYFQNNLRANQRRLLKVTRDRSFLLDRLLCYERPDLSSSDNETTDSSEDSLRIEPVAKKRRSDANASRSSSTVVPTKRTNKKGPRKQSSQQGPSSHQGTPQQSYAVASAESAGNPTEIPQLHKPPSELLEAPFIPELMKPNHADSASTEKQLTKEEIERHLQSRKMVPEVVPEGELPSEMFNNNPSDGESNDGLDEPSAGNFEDDCFPADLNLLQ